MEKRKSLHTKNNYKRDVSKMSYAEAIAEYNKLVLMMQKSKMVISQQGNPYEKGKLYFPKGIIQYKLNIIKQRLTNLSKQ